MERTPITTATARARARAVRARRAARFIGSPGAAAWVELGGRELRVRTDDGEWLSSFALPDANAALGHLEFAAGDLADLGAASEDEEGGVFA